MNTPYRPPRGPVGGLLRFGGQQLDRLRDLIAPADLSVTAYNARNLCIEMFWAAFMSAAATFNALFAIRLGATNAEVGLLSSLPALVALIVTIPAGLIINRQKKRMPLMVRALFIHRLGFLLAIFIPWLPIEHKGMALIWLLVVFSAPAHIFGVGWNWLLAELIPEVDRARVLATRNIVLAIASTAGIFLAGRWLDRATFPFNFQVMYSVGFVASMISLTYIVKLRVSDSVVPDSPARTPGDAGQRNAFRAAWEGFRSVPVTIRQAATEQPDFVRIVINTLAHGIGLWMIGPIYVLYFVRTLGATDGWIGLNGTVASLLPVIGFALWQRGIARWGENRVLRWTISVVGIYPILVGLSPNLTVILIWTAINGLVTPGTSLSHYPMLLKVCPATDRPRYLAVYIATMNLAAFIAPLLGVWLAGRIGFGPMLALGGALCLLGSSLFRWRPLQMSDSLAARHAGFAA